MNLLKINGVIELVKYNDVPINDDDDDLLFKIKLQIVSFL